MDLDIVEYRIIDGQRVPVGVIEVTRLDMAMPPKPAYFRAWLDRINKRDDNAAALKQFAEMLCCDVYLVAAQHPGLNWFFVYNLSTGKGWIQMDQFKLMEWLQGLKAVKRFDPTYVPPWFY